MICSVSRSGLKCLLVSTAVLLSLFLPSTVNAFGGLRSKRMFNPESVRGVDAFGFYFGGEGQIDIKFVPCSDSNASRDSHGVCQCNPKFKFETEITENGEIQKCVVDACYGVALNDGCISCSSKNGIATKDLSSTVCKAGKWVCNVNHNCINPCEMIENDDDFDSECQKCEPNGNETKAENLSNSTKCTDPNGGLGNKNWTCKNGHCVNPCNDKSNPDDNPCFDSWIAIGGVCVEKYKVGKSCGTDKSCSTEGKCDWNTCPDEIKVRDEQGNCICPQELHKDLTEICEHPKTFSTDSCECVCDRSIYPLANEPDTTKFDSESCTYNGNTYYKKTGCKFGYTKTDDLFTDCVYNCNGFNDYGNFDSDCAECYIDDINGNAEARSKEGTCKLTTDTGDKKNGKCDQGKCKNPCEIDPPEINDEMDPNCINISAREGQCILEYLSGKTCGESGTHKTCHDGYCLCDDENNYQDENGMCYLDVCKAENFAPTTCTTKCTSSQGKAIYKYASADTSCDTNLGNIFACNQANGLCVCKNWGYFRDSDDNCQLCSDPNIPRVKSAEYCAQCTYTGYPRFMGIGNYVDKHCFLCSTKMDIPTTKEECDRCANRVYENERCTLCQDGWKVENEKCVIDACYGFKEETCKTSCSSTNGHAEYAKPVGKTCGTHMTCNSNGDCECASGYYKDEDDGNCYKDVCKEEASQKNSACVLKCENVKGIARYTYADSTVPCGEVGENKACDGNGICDCALGYKMNDNVCVQTSCGEYSEDCISSCGDSPKFVKSGTPCGSDNNSVCNGKGFCVCKLTYQAFRDRYGECKACSSSEPFYVSHSSYCAECNSETRYTRFMGDNYRCYLCTEPDAIVTSSIECSRCANRIYHADTSKCEFCGIGKKVENGKCVRDACYGVTENICKTDCKSVNEQATYTILRGLTCGTNKVCDATGDCVCDEEKNYQNENGTCYKNMCKDWSPSSECESACTSTRGERRITIRVGESCGAQGSGKVCRTDGTCACPVGSTDENGVCKADTCQQQKEENDCIKECTPLTYRVMENCNNGNKDYYCDTEGHCICTDYSSFRGTKKCESCLTQDPVLVSDPYHCAKCPDEYPRFMAGNYCFSCRYKQDVVTTKEECDRCNRSIEIREFDSQTNKCKLIPGKCDNVPCSACEQCNIDTGECEPIRKENTPFVTIKCDFDVGFCSTNGKCCYQHMPESCSFSDCQMLMGWHASGGIPQVIEWDYDKSICKVKE